MTDEELKLVFAMWAQTNNVSLVHEDDWLNWWECWKSGYDAGKKAEQDILANYWSI